MAETQQELQAQLKLSQTLIFVLLALAVLTFLLLFWRTYNLGSICAAPPPQAPSAKPPKGI